MTGAGVPIAPSPDVVAVLSGSKCPVATCGVEARPILALSNDAHQRLLCLLKRDSSPISPNKTA
jgi:hypothetical protein